MRHVPMEQEFAEAGDDVRMVTPPRSRGAAMSSHTVQDADMIEHIVQLVEAKAAEIEAAEAAQAQAAE